MTDEMKVTLTLRKSVTEKLRRICHAKGQTASHVVDSWIFEHDERGNPIVKQEPAREPSFADIGSDIVKRIREGLKR